MFIQRQTVSITTDGSGDGTGYTERPVNGRISSIQYVKTDYADGVDITVTGETTGIGILIVSSMNASAVYAPRQPVHYSSTGAAITYDGTYPAFDYVCLDGERVKIVVAQGGDTKSGTFYVTVE